MTSEACVAETLFLCGRNRVSTEPLFFLLETGTLRVESMLGEAPQVVTQLMRRWANVPMSLADASLVLLHERTPRSVVVTFDSDFGVYRTTKGRPIHTFGP